MDNDTPAGIPTTDPPAQATPPAAAEASMQEGLLRLAALLALLGAAGGLYAWAGPTALSAVAVVGTGLFTAWQRRGDDGSR
jgi:hypothetical protein